MKLRPLHRIAAEVLVAWGPQARDPRSAPFHQTNCIPYLDAMLHLEKVSDHYGLDDAEDIILRFLVNASSWRGEQARAIKAELNQHLKEKSC